MEGHSWGDGGDGHKNTEVTKGDFTGSSRGHDEAVLWECGLGRVAVGTGLVVDGVAREHRGVHLERDILAI